MNFLLSGLNPWTYLDKNSFGMPDNVAEGVAATGNHALKNTTSMIYLMLFVLAVVGVVVTLLIAFIKSSWTSNGLERMVSKDEIVQKILVGCGVFFVPTMLSIMYVLASGLLSAS